VVVITICILLCVCAWAIEGQRGDWLFGEWKPRILRWIVANILMCILASSYLVCAWIARDCLGINVITPFRNPYLATSLTEFWSFRWNILISRLLKETVYKPCISAFDGRLPAAAVVGMLLSFLVSGLMHEFMILHLDPKYFGFFMLFFACHGAAAICENLGTRLTAPLRLSERYPAAMRRASFLLTFVFVYLTTESFFVPAIVGMRMPDYWHTIMVQVEAIVTAGASEASSVLFGARGGSAEL